MVTEKVMLTYMLERCEQLKSPANLWCEYSMLKATINCNKKIDISKFPKLIGFLKSKNNGYRPKKSAVLEREEICKFLAEADDEMYLLIKVSYSLIMIFSVDCQVEYNSWSNFFCKICHLRHS
jgi:hypothetical protein